MSATKKDRFIHTTSGRLHVPANIVRLVVEAWETERKTPGGADHRELDHVGGGWYALPNGEKVQGREAALAWFEANG